MPGGPRMSQGGADSLELYLTNALTVPPTNTVEQADIVPGIPAPVITNTGEANLATSGALRTTAATDPTVYVKIMDLGKGHISHLLKLVQDAMGGGSTTIADLVQAVRALQANQPTPRFAVKRVNYDQGDDSDFVGVTEDFFPWTAEILGTPPDETIIAPDNDWPIVDQVPIVEASDGTMRILMLVENANVSPFEYDILVYSYNPATDTAPVYWTGTASHNLSLLCDETITTGVRFAAKRGPDGHIYMVVFGYRTSGPTTYPHFWVFRLRGLSSSTATIEKVSDGIDITYEVALSFPLASVALEFIDTGALVLYGLGTTGSPVHELQMAYSPDLQTWSQIGTQSAFASEYDIHRSRASGLMPQAITATHFYSSGLGFMVTSRGHIWKSKDAGVSWHDRDNPATGTNEYNVQKRPYALRAVQAVSATVAYAVGEAGLILKSTDSGTTWQIAAFNQGGSLAHFDANAYVTAGGGVAAISVTDHDINGIYMRSETVGWICTTGGEVVYTSDGWLSKQRIIYWQRGAYLSVVGDASDTIQLAAVAGTHMDSTVSAWLRNSSILQIENATTEKAFNSADLDHYVTTGANSAGLSAMVSLTRPTSGVAMNDAGSVNYALGNDGSVWRWDGGGASPGAWTRIARLGSAANGGFADVFSPDGAQATVFVLGSDALMSGRALWSSANGTAATPTWKLRQSPIRAVAMHFWSATSGVLVGPTGAAYINAVSDERTWGDLLRLSTGELLMICINYSRLQIEVFRCSRPNVELQFSLVDEVSYTRLNYGVEAASEQPRARLFEDSDGTVYMLAGFEGPVAGGEPTGAQVGRVSFDRGLTWIPRDDAVLPIPLGVLDTASFVGGVTQYDINSSLFVTAWGAGRFWASAIEDDPTGDVLHLWVARAWDGTVGRTTHYLAVSDLPQWLGVDDVDLRWYGTPSPNDSWTIAPAYRSSVELLTRESPSVKWRSITDNQVVDHIYDRAHADVVEVLGPGRFWEATAFALFGTNFRQVEFAITIPTWDSADWPANPDDYTTYAYNNSCAAGTIGTGGIACEGSLMRDTSKTWEPHQWAPGFQQFYCYVSNDPDTGLPGVFKIVDSSTDALLLERAASGGDLNAGAATYIIFSDRHFWNGVGGTGPGSAGLFNSAYRFGRLIRIRIPSQPTAEGYYQMGTPFAGPHVPYDYYPSTSKDLKQRGAGNIVWRPVPNTIETVGPSGVTSVEGFGAGRAWELSYEAEEGWSRDMKLAGLLTERTPGRGIRRAFCWVPFGDDPQTALLVRYVDGPESRVIPGLDRWASTHRLVEVL